LLPVAEWSNYRYHDENPLSATVEEVYLSKIIIEKYTKTKLVDKKKTPLQMS
jgi:hypothetical protein